MLYSIRERNCFLYLIIGCQATGLFQIYLSLLWLQHKQLPFDDVCWSYWVSNIYTKNRFSPFIKQVSVPCPSLRGIRNLYTHIPTDLVGNLMGCMSLLIKFIWWVCPVSYFILSWRHSGYSQLWSSMPSTTNVMVKGPFTRLQRFPNN